MSHIEIEHFNEEEKERLRKCYTSVQLGQEHIRTNPGNAVLPVSYEKFKDAIYSWKLNDGDMFVFGWVKTGTTWAREMVWCLVNDCDLEKANTLLLNERIPFLDMAVLADFDDNCSDELGHKAENLLSHIQSLPSPKILKSHFQFDMFPPDLLDRCKVVMCLRNPKDTLVSYYHHEKLIKLHGYVGDFPTYFDLFMDNLVIYSSFFSYTVGAWERRNHPNMHIIFYEDMKEDLASEIEKVAKFLGKVITNEQVEKLVVHLGFGKMKANNSVNNEAIRNVAFVNGAEGSFIRKGEVGDWKNYFTDEMNKRMDEAIEKHFKDIGLKFKYEL